MNSKKNQVDDCGCEHHTHEKGSSHHLDGKCHIDSFVEDLVESVKKEFEKDDK